MVNVRRINLYVINIKRYCDKGERGCGFFIWFCLWRYGGCCFVKKKINENMGKFNNLCNLV